MIKNNKTATFQIQNFIQIIKQTYKDKLKKTILLSNTTKTKKRKKFLHFLFQIFQFGDLFYPRKFVFADTFPFETGPGGRRRQFEINRRFRPKKIFLKNFEILGKFFEILLNLLRF